ncbi:MAG: glutaredoxin family protein [Pseudomonadota bacterium]
MTVTKTSFFANNGPWVLIFIVIAGSWILSRGGADVEPIYCEIDKPTESADVVMLSASWCGYCRRARKLFVNEAINYCELDIEQSASGRQRYQQSRIKVVPIIHIKDEVIVGFSKSEVLQSLASHDLYPLEKI